MTLCQDYSQNGSYGSVVGIATMLGSGQCGV